MGNWSGLDFFIFLILLLNTLLGMARGATKEIIAMSCLCIALIFTIKFTIPLAAFLNQSPLIVDVIGSNVAQNFMAAIGMPPLTQEMLFHVGYCISLLICFVGVYSVCAAVLFYSNVAEMFPFPYAAINRKLGAGMGAARGFVITLILILILQHLYSGAMSGSFFVNLFQNSAQKLDYLISAQAPERYKEILQDKDLYGSEQILKALDHSPQ